MAHWCSREVEEEWRARGSPRVVIGVDGGATSTQCAVLSLEPPASPSLPLTKEAVEVRVRGVGRAGSSNRNSVGEARAKAELQGAISSALAAARTPHLAVQAAAACMAGVDRPQDVALVSSWIREWFPEPVRVAVHNDAVAALASGTLGHIPGITPPPEENAARQPASGAAPPLAQRQGQGQGDGAIVVIAGTGSIVYGINSEGRTARASGAGPLLGDRGSGYAIASEALSAIMRADDGRGPPTALSGAVLEHLGLSAASDLIGWIYSDLAWSRVAALLPVVKRCAAEGDSVAVGIVEEAVEELAQGVRAVALRLGAPAKGSEPLEPGDGCAGGSQGQVSVIAAGGVLEDTSVPDLRGRLQQRLEHLLPGAVMAVPQVDASVGAALIALHLAR